MPEPSPQSPKSFLGLSRFKGWLSALARAAKLEEEVSRQSRRADQMDALFEELKQHVWESFRQIADVNQRSEERHRKLEKETEELIQSQADLSQREAEGREQFVALRREIMFQQRRLSRLTDDLTAAECGAPQVAQSLYDERIDSLYVAFEDVFRGTRADIKSRLSPYLEPIKLAGAGAPGKPILDIGCGRGEWLELLAENHLDAYGVDLNSMMVERCKSYGFNASKADALLHLSELPDASLSAITAFHFIEHIPFEIFINFLDEALRVLVSGGVLILETPNPETVRVGSTTFYYDPTHRNPLPPIPTSFIVEHRGFSDVEILRLHPVEDEKLAPTDENMKILNRVLFGPQDYAIIARRDKISTQT